MNTTYFESTDTLFIQLTDDEVISTEEINENVYVDFGAQEKVISITVENAGKECSILEFVYAGFNEHTSSTPRRH